MYITMLHNSQNKQTGDITATTDAISNPFMSHFHFNLNLFI